MYANVTGTQYLVTECNRNDSFNLVPTKTNLNIVVFKCNQYIKITDLR